MKATCSVWDGNKALEDQDQGKPSQDSVQIRPSLKEGTAEADLNKCNLSTALSENKGTVRVGRVVQMKDGASLTGAQRI